MPNPLELLAAQSRQAALGRPAAPPAPVAPPPDLAEVEGRLLPKNQGAFLSALNWLSRPGQVVKNAITGNLEGAARQAGDFGLDVVDALIPFVDAIPELSRQQDYIEGSDIVGVDKEKHPILGTLASLGVDVALDPLTYTGLGPLIKGAKLAGEGAAAGIKLLPKGAEALTKGSEALSQLGRKTRSVFGAQRLSPEAQAAVDAGKGAAATVRSAGTAEAQRIASGLTKTEREVAGDILDNLQFDEAGKAVGALADPGADLGADLAARLAKHPLLALVDQNKVLKAAEETLSFGERQFGEGVKRGFFNDAGGIKGYVPRKYKGQTGDQALDEALGLGKGEMGLPSAIKARSLQTPDEIVNFLKSNDDVAYVRDIGERLVDRAGQQGSLASKAAIGKQILGDAFSLADDTQRSAMMTRIREMAVKDPESAKVLLDAFKGLPPRGGFLQTLSKINKVVKPMMVYGYAIPKFGSVVRNKIGGIWQALSNPAARGTVMGQVKRLPSDLAGAVTDSLGLKIGKDALGQAIGALDDAIRNSGGVADEAARLLQGSAGAGGFSGQQLADLFRSGTLDGFVSSENLVSEMARTGWKAKYQNIVDWPGRMFRGVEDRMRAGMWLDLVKSGKSTEEAAKIVRDALYDYSVSSVGNRTARDLIPFFQFPAKAIPQQAKFLAEKPAVAVGIASLLLEREGEPKPSWMEGKLVLPLGTNAQGERQYAAGFGLPFEALSLIPNPSSSVQQFGRDIGRGVVGASQPALKTGLSAAFGVDPYFGSTFGSYSKLPGNVDAGAAGRAINILRGTGLTQPLESLAGTVGKLADNRQSGGLKALDFLTGANVVSVDPDRALQQRLTEYLRQNPEVASIQSLYTKTDDPEAVALIRELNSAKARLRAKRQAASPTP